MTDLSQIAEQEWNEANRRALVVRPLIEFKHCPREKASAAAAKLGLSDRQIYRLIQRLRKLDGELTTLLPGGSSGVRGKQRLAAPREALLHRLIVEVFITPQKRSAADLIRAIRNQSLKGGLVPPSESTIRRRLKTLSLTERCQRGEQHTETKPIYGVTRDIEARWPIAGKPQRLGVDNASEFHSAAFERGCAQHNITIEWRPPGLPHFGGVIERVNWHSRISNRYSVGDSQI